MRLTKNSKYNSRWSGKTWSCIGDSITEVNAKTTVHYHDYIKQWIGCKVNNYGISGTGWRTPSASGGTNAIYQRLNTIDSNSDLITVFAGINDWGEVGIPMTLGSFGDTSASTSFYGAVDKVLSTLVTNYATKTIAVFTPIQNAGAWYNLQHGTDGVTLQDISNAIIAVANKYNVPVLDLYRNGNIYAQNTTFQSNYLPDGTHPNASGHLILANKILAFLNSL